MPARYASAFVKGNKNDFRDACYCRAVPATFVTPKKGTLRKRSSGSLGLAAAFLMLAVSNWARERGNLSCLGGFGMGDAVAPLVIHIRCATGRYYAEYREGDENATAEPATITMYVNPQCSCCEGHAQYLRENGFKVTVTPTHDMTMIRQQHGVPEKFEGCHIALVDGYVVEGHVPASAIKKLLAERPKIKAISLPGMPEGSPGMTGQKTEPFTILEISDQAKVFAVE